MGTLLRALIIEDTEDDALLIARRLKQDGYNLVYERVDTVASMLESLDKQDWDIIIADYVLPQFSGLEALKMLKEKNPDLPCIIVSGKISDETAVAAIKAGARDYIMKDNLKRLGPTVARELAEVEVQRKSRRAEEELQLRAAILDKATDSIFLRDMENKIVYVNDAACKTFGYTKDELIGTNFRSFILPQAIPLFEERLKTVMKNKPITVEGHYVCKNKSLVPVEVHTHRIQIGRRSYILSLTRDITRRKQGEEELILRATLLDKALDAILLRDMNDHFIYVNDAACQMFGYSKDEFQKIAIDSLIIPEEVPRFGNKKKELREKGQVKTETFHLRKDGSVFPAEVYAHLIKIGEKEYILSVNRDFTERKRAEDRIQQNEEQLEQVFNALTEGIALIGPDGRILKTNPAEEKIRGLKASELVGEHFRRKEIEYIYADGRELPLEETAVSQAIKRKRTVRDLETGNIKPDGSVQWVNVNAIPIRDKDGNITAVVRTLTDITEKKHLLNEKENFTQRLLEVQEEERKRIARELHDDTAQNLALLVLEIDNLLNSREQLPAKVLENLKKLREDTDRTQREVRRYSHELRPGVFEYLGLEAALEGLVQDTNERGGAKVKLEISGEGRRLAENVELALFRISQEAINNVWKHSDATEAQISLKYSPENITLSISDNGKGFKPPKQKTGIVAGLGLMGIRERAQLIGASLKIRSVIGRGTTVSVKVPK